jgi:hypothetical protein
MPSDVVFYSDFLCSDLQPEGQHGDSEYISTGRGLFDVSRHCLDGHTTTNAVGSEWMYIQPPLADTAGPITIYNQSDPDRIREDLNYLAQRRRAAKI